MNPALFLAAIAMVESSNNDFARGHDNEVSRYQIKPQIWQQYALLRKQDYTNSKIAYNVALKHLTHLQKNKPSFVSNSISHMAIMWNWGPTNFKIAHYHIGNAPISVQNYAERVNNIYERLTTQIHGDIVSSMGTNNQNYCGYCTFEVDIKSAF